MTTFIYRPHHHQRWSANADSWCDPFTHLCHPVPFSLSRRTLGGLKGHPFLTVLPKQLLTNNVDKYVLFLVLKMSSN